MNSNDGSDISKLGAGDRENRGDHGGGVVGEARTIKQNPRGWIAVANESMENPRSLDPVAWNQWLSPVASIGATLAATERR